MKVELRRNMSFSCSFTMQPSNKEAIEQLLKDVPQLTPEQQRLADEADQRRHALEEQIWQQVEQLKPLDLDGDLITRETHQIGFDYDFHEEYGCMVGDVKTIYIQPKKSEFEKEKEEL